VIRVSLRYKVAYDPTPQTLYRKSPGQMSSNWMVMLDAIRAVQRKNRTYAPNAWQYWIDCAFGRFENGRRALYACLFEYRGNRWSMLVRLCLRYPYMLWVGPLSVLSFVLGKRPSGKDETAHSEIAQAVDA